jgi:hypothetical protein
MAKLDWTHAVFVAASAVSAGATAWAHADPEHAMWAHVLLAVSSTVVTAFGLASNSVLAPSAAESDPLPPPAPKQLPVRSPDAVR